MGMRVKEVIVELQKQNPEMVVLDSEYIPIERVDIKVAGKSNHDVYFSEYEMNEDKHEECVVVVIE